MTTRFIIVPTKLTISSHQFLVKKGVGLKTEEDIDNPNFLRRYKWALKPHHPAIRTQDILVPDQREFIGDCRNLQV